MPNTLNKTENPKKFVIVTETLDGFGFAKHLIEEGNEVLMAYRMQEDEENPDEFDKVGE